MLARLYDREVPSQLHVAIIR